jgi:hypothetical protein
MLLFPDGSKYRGNWENGNLQGRCTYIDSNGEEREGEWVEGKRIKWVKEDNQKSEQIYNNLSRLFVDNYFYISYCIL